MVARRNEIEKEIRKSKTETKKVSVFVSVTRPGNMHIPSFVNQGEALHIINSAGIVYHQHAVLYIIKPQENTR